MGIYGGHCMLSEYAPRDRWAQFGAGRTAYTYLGRIRPGLTEATIEADARRLLANMGAYNIVSNNCFTFVNKIYEDERIF